MGTTSLTGSVAIGGVAAASGNTLMLPGGVTATTASGTGGGSSSSSGHHPHGSPLAFGGSGSPTATSMRVRLFVSAGGVLCARYQASTQESGTLDPASSSPHTPSHHGHHPSNTTQHHGTVVSFLQAEGVLLQTRRWYHFCLVHERSRFQGLFGGSSENKLYVDGVLCGAVKVNVAPQGPNTRLATQWGTPTNPTILFQGPQPTPVQWRLGPSYVLEGAASASTVLAVRQLGAHYWGHFATAGPQLATTCLAPDVVSHTLLTQILALFAAQQASGGNSGLAAGGYAALKELGQLAGLVGAGTAGPLGSTLVTSGNDPSGAHSTHATELDTVRLVTDSIVAPFTPDRIVLAISAPRLLQAASLLGSASLTSIVANNVSALVAAQQQQQLSASAGSSGTTGLTGSNSNNATGTGSTNANNSNNAAAAAGGQPALPTEPPGTTSAAPVVFVNSDESPMPSSSISSSTFTPPEGLLEAALLLHAENVLPSTARVTGAQVRLVVSSLLFFNHVFFFGPIFLFVVF